MKIIVGLLGSLFAVLSTGVLLYVSMATGLGPWMAPTIVLIGGVLLRLVSRSSQKNWQTDVVIIQTIGSTGGAIATAVGFSLPTLFFLHQKTFNAWLAQPWWFAGMLAAFTFAAGWWGVWIARQQSAELLSDTSLRFPVSVAIYETIISQTQKVARWLLACGVSFALFVSFARDGFGRIAPLISRTFYVGRAVFGGALPIDLMPVSWAIGFLAGTPIVLPLVVGMLSKYLVVWPLNMHSLFMPFSLFAPLPAIDFTFAFCSGIVLSQTINSLFSLPQMIMSGAQKLWQHKTVKADSIGSLSWYQLMCQYEWVIAGLGVVAVLSYLSFPPLAQIMLLGLSCLFIRHLNAFACRTGLGAYGRYMTYTMVPVMLAVTVNDIQVTMLCVFIGIAGSAAVDMLFGYKAAQLAGVPIARVHRAQLLGVLVTAACMGWLFWLLCSHFELGSLQLVAHRSRARALLLHSYHFQWTVLALGALYGMLLKKMRINPILAFGGLIMPNQITIGLALGAAVRAATRNPDEYTPFWSGVFAGDALWVLSTLLF